MKKKGIWRYNLRKIQKYLEVMKISFLSSSSYSRDVLGSLIFLFLILFIMFSLWRVIFSSNGSGLAHFTLSKMLWYVASTEALMLSGSKLRVRIDSEIRSGNIANFLVKPFFYPLFLVFDSLGSSIFSLIIRLPVAFTVALFFTLRLELTINGFLSYVILGFLGLVLDALITIFIGFFAFFIEDTAPVYWIYNKMLFTIGGLLIPVDIMPEIIKKVSYYLPFRFVLYNPAISCVNFSLNFFIASLVGVSISILVMLFLTSMEFSVASRRLSINGG